MGEHPNATFHYSNCGMRPLVARTGDPGVACACLARKSAELAEARAEIVAIEQKLGVDRDRADRAEAETARLRAAEAEAFAARANETRYREALERIADTPLGCLSEHSRIAQKALDTQAREDG